MGGDRQLHDETYNVDELYTVEFGEEDDDQQVFSGPACSLLHLLINLLDMVHLPPAISSGAWGVDH